MQLLVLVAIAFAILSVIFVTLGVVAFRKKRLLGSAADMTVAALMLSLAALCATITVATRGYQALTHEEVVAWVATVPTGDQTFAAKVRFPDGTERTYSLAGDEFYIDAHILKWKSIANLLGLHTQYELDRVSGRYIDLDDEQSKLRTVFGLSVEKPVDMFALRRRWTAFGPLVDAEYGSASFVDTRTPSAFEVRVSTTGLLIRPVENGGS